jgi:hypothetical protein
MEIGGPRTSGYFVNHSYYKRLEAFSRPDQGGPMFCMRGFQTLLKMTAAVVIRGDK